MDRNDQIARARRLGAEHGHAGIAPYGDLADAGSAELMTALGETDPAGPGNHDWRMKLLTDYECAWEYAAGRAYMSPPTPAGVLTPRGFVLALAADGIDAKLEILGGPGSWPMPIGHLPDGRGWILGDEDDQGWVGPDAPLPGPLHLQVYESATENASRWPDRQGLEFNDTVGILGRLSSVQADMLIRRAWSGDYAMFEAAGDLIGPAPLPEDIATDDGSPMFGEDSRRYLRAARLAAPVAVEPWRTEVCPECGETIHGGGLVVASSGERAHVVLRGSVVLGCEGMRVIDPAALGLGRGEWLDWRGDLDAAYINDRGAAMGDQRYQVTLFGAYVGHAVGSYPEALALLRPEVEAIDWTAVAGAPQGWEPPVFYMDHRTMTIARFPLRLAQVRPDWDRPARLEDQAWWASLGPHIGVEAMCLLCGETCNPHGPDDMVHGQREDEQPCGGPLVALGAWGAPVRAGQASAIGPARVGIPYAWTDPESGARTCPACQAVIAEDYDGDGEPLTHNYADHYQREHGNR